MTTGEVVTGHPDQFLPVLPFSRLLPLAYQIYYASAADFRSDVKWSLAVFILTAQNHLHFFFYLLCHCLTEFLQAALRDGLFDEAESVLEQTRVNPAIFWQASIDLMIEV